MNWDHHDFIYSSKSTEIKGGGPGAGRWGIGTWPMTGSTDQALAALLEDMHASGLLDTTLVCFVTEFGRTPKINERQGRDHWTHAFSFAFAGAGVPGGQVVGATDKDGGYITSSMAYTIDDYRGHDLREARHRSEQADPHAGQSADLPGQKTASRSRNCFDHGKTLLPRATSF